ncbi:hypothetical protein MSG28_007452 [Choristoneura fumiferana]|uniref:Uncharacterized protein n=1 Tax=Choristoneura fumiferana TaxID=7141 RepID=A0ACC0JXC2_CHOFU|nr:hypothetical protein MSG28_007452 [Choristoneura fumiferana]
MFGNLKLPLIKQKGCKEEPLYCYRSVKTKPPKTPTLRAKRHQRRCVSTRDVQGCAAWTVFFIYLSSHSIALVETAEQREARVNREMELQIA